MYYGMIPGCCLAATSSGLVEGVCIHTHTPIYNMYTNYLYLIYNLVAAFMLRSRTLIRLLRARSGRHLVTDLIYTE